MVSRAYCLQITSIFNRMCVRMQLQRLESTAAYLPTSERPLMNSVLRNHRITKPYTVRFDPGSTRGGENVSLKDASGVPPQTLHVYYGNGPSVDEKENLVEGVVLNDTKDLPTGGRKEHEGRGETRTGGGISGTQHVASQQEATGEPNTQTSPIQAALQRAHSAKTDSLSLSPVSNPNTAGSSPHRRAHSNANAVFGPPVSFSAWKAQQSTVHQRPPLPGPEVRTCCPGRCLVGLLPSTLSHCSLWYLCSVPVQLSADQLGKPIQPPPTIITMVSSPSVPQCLPSLHPLGSLSYHQV